jgi:hypothetical protein
MKSINKGGVNSAIQQGGSNRPKGLKVTLEFYISKLNVSYFNNVVGSSSIEMGILLGRREFLIET